MEGIDYFAAALEQSAVLLRYAHRREVDDLQAQIAELKSLEHLSAQVRLDHDREINDLRVRISEVSLSSALRGKMPRGQSPPSLTPRPWAQDVPVGSGEECAAADTSQSTPPDWSSTVNKMQQIALGSTSHKRLKIARPTILDRSSNPRVALIENLVSSNGFELLFCVAIALNTVVIALEAQYAGFCTAADFEYDTGYASMAKTWSGAEDLFVLFEWFFGILFSIEIVLRIIGLRVKFVYSAWNWVDLAVSLIWFVSIWESRLTVNPMVVRLGRFARLARLVRIVRKIQGFDSLVLITTALRGSVSILGWTCCMLGLILVLFALLLNGFLMDFYFRDETLPQTERSEIFRYFGSFTSAVFSMFELTLANWPPVARALSDNVSEWFILITLLHKLTVGFAVVGVINGVFIQETFKVAQQDDEIMMRQARHSKTTHERKMRQLVATADASVDGMLDIEEFREIFENPALKDWLASMELVPRDVDALFAMMDDGDGILSVEEVIKGVAQFKGGARNFDLHVLLHEHKELLQEFRDLQASLEENLLPHRARSAARTKDLDVTCSRTSRSGGAHTPSQRASRAARRERATKVQGWRSGAAAILPKE